MAGFLAAGESGFNTADPTATDNNTTFRPDSIWHNATAFFELIMNGTPQSGDTTGFGFASAIGSNGLLKLAASTFPFPGVGILVSILFAIFIAGVMLFIAVEMFVARVEFYTMLMLSIVFLPFGVTERLAFLANSAISLVFNSGAKMMVICFLQVMIAKILSAYLQKLTLNPIENFSVLLQLLILVVFFAYLTKNIPQLVSSFLNGSPALSGGGMIQQASSMARTAGMVVGGVAGASAAASGLAASGGGMATKMSQLGAPGRAVGHALDTMGILGKAGAQNLMANNPFTQGYTSGVKGVLGNDGSIRGKGAAQNVGFMQGVRKLAGLELNGQPNATQSMLSVARDGWQKKPSTPEGVIGKPPTGSDGKPMPSSSFRKMPSSQQVRQHPDHSGKGVNISVGGNGGGSGNPPTNPVSPQPGMSKTTEKTKESTFRQESVHTSNEKNTQISTPGSGGSITHSTGTSNPVSGMQTNVTNNSSSTTTNISSNNSSGNKPDGGMSNLGNFGKK